MEGRAGWGEGEGGGVRAGGEGGEGEESAEEERVGHCFWGEDEVRVSVMSLVWISGVVRFGGYRGREIGLDRAESASLFWGVCDTLVPFISFYEYHNKGAFQLLRVKY